MLDTRIWVSPTFLWMLDTRIWVSPTFLCMLDTRIWVSPAYVVVYFVFSDVRELEVVFRFRPSLFTLFS
jgi:hypothetical protein